MNRRVHLSTLMINQDRDYKSVHALFPLLAARSRPHKLLRAGQAEIVLRMQGINAIRVDELRLHSKH
jgi:hypothetical protein